MTTKKTGARFAFLSTYRLPLLSGVILVVACLCSTLDIRPHSAADDPLILQIAYFTGRTFTQLFFVLSVGLLLLARTRHFPKRTVDWLFGWLLCTLVFTSLLVWGLKTLTHLPRPDGQPTGFPSGHTIASFVLAWLVFETLPSWGPLWFALAVAVGWSRVQTQAHFTYQVLSGAAFGCAIGWLACRWREGSFPSGLRGLRYGLRSSLMHERLRQSSMQPGDAGVSAADSSSADQS